MKLLSRSAYPSNTTRLVRWRGWRAAVSRTDLPWEFAVQVGGPEYVFALFWGRWSLRIVNVPAYRERRRPDVFVPEPAGDGL